MRRSDPHQLRAARLPFYSRLTRGQRHPETCDADRTTRGEAHAPRGPMKLGGEQEGAVTGHPICARSRPLSNEDNTAGECRDPVLAPFPNIPVRVIQAPWIRQFLPHRINTSEVASGVYPCVNAACY